jgi:cephalosporin hydroxylase
MPFARVLKPLASLLYHRWFYDCGIWEQITWRGTHVHKSPMDLWNYQEIIHALRPSLLIEFGSWAGGSTQYFASVLRDLGQPFRVLSVDIDHSRVKDIHGDENIIFMTADSASAEVADRIAGLRAQFPGPVFAILDSDHAKKHVLAEMLSLRPLLRSGDYLIVEDSNINGHPVLRGFGPGPYEAIEEYFIVNPDDYVHDLQRETKFGFTFAPNGFLIRK